MPGKKLLKWWSYVDTWPFYGKVKFASPCICMGHIHLYGKMLRIHILDISSIIQFSWNLMMSIRAPGRHKIAKWADRKSKIAATAAILKIDFRHLFPNFWLLCSVATGSEWAKILLIGIPRWPLVMLPLHWTRWPPELQIENLQTTSRSWPMAWFQNICTEVFLQWPSTKLLKWFCLAAKVAARAKNRKTFKRHLHGQ